LGVTRHITITSCVLGAFAFAAGAQELSPAGRWRTVDDETGASKSIVVITVSNGEARGTIEKVFIPPAVDDHPVCIKCGGDRRNKPVIGMEIMWGLKKDGDEYTGGRVFDPETGKTYRCKIRVVDGGRKLLVRGFVGFSLLGRTQTWLRE
jgi:uncharacterized protein (DUF2147 family)